MRLEADRVSFAYPRQAPCLHEVSLAIDAAEIVFVLGANGSGKSTLLGLLAGTRRPTSGVVRLDGQPLLARPLRERAQRIAWVPQFVEPAFALCVEEAVALGRTPHLGPFASPGPGDRAAVAQALDTVGLTPLRRRPTNRLSGGERQLVWIARGLAQGARFLFLDEPTAHLDPAHEKRVFDVLRDLRAAGASLVLASHHPESALLHATRVAFLKHGRLLAAGPPETSMTAETLRDAYGLDFALVAGPDGDRAIVRRHAGDPETSSRRT